MRHNVRLELARMEDEKNILEVGLLHRLMVLFQRPVAWPAPAVLAFTALLAAAVGALWYLAGAPAGIALPAAAIAFLFGAADALLLWHLPRRRISFGPWKAQVVVLAVPRTGAGLALVLLAPWLGWGSLLAVLFLGQLLGLALLYWGAAVEPRRLSMTELQLTLPGLPPNKPPVRLLHISDVHLERHTDREEALLSLVRRARPDLIVLTGDYLNLSYNEDPTTLAQIRRFVQRLQAPSGVYATLGSPPVDLRQSVLPAFEGLPVCLLRDEWTVVDAGQGRRLVLMGLDCSHHLDVDGERLARVARAAPNGVPRVLLYHSPELMPQASGHGVDLYLCGHTHGGQVRLPLIGPILTSSQLGRRYVMGHYRNGRTHLYVSRGVGLEGLSAPRVRFLSPPEITLVTLHPE